MEQPANQDRNRAFNTWQRLGVVHEKMERGRESKGDAHLSVLGLTIMAKKATSQRWGGCRKASKCKRFNPRLGDCRCTHLAVFACVRRSGRWPRRRVCVLLAQMEAMLSIPWEELKVGECVGIGTYKTVYEAKHNGKKVAVLKMRQNLSVDVEAELLLSLGDHPRLATFFGKTIADDGAECLVSGTITPPPLPPPPPSTLPREHVLRGYGGMFVNQHSPDTDHSTRCWKNAATNAPPRSLPLQHHHLIPPSHKRVNA